MVTFADLTLPTRKPSQGRQVPYIDKTLKGFGVRVSENGQMSYVLTYGPNRQRAKLGDVGNGASLWTGWPPNDCAAASALTGGAGSR